MRLDSSVKKETELLTLPRLLTIQLKRFRATASGYVKDNSVVILPRGELRLRNVSFRVVATVDHSGSMISGHYTANVKLNGRWKTCNDRRIYDDPNMTLKSKGAYLLFYEKILNL